MVDPMTKMMIDIVNVIDMIVIAREIKKRRRTLKREIMTNNAIIRTLIVKTTSNEMIRKDMVILARTILK